MFLGFIAILPSFRSIPPVCPELCGGTLNLLMLLGINVCEQYSCIFFFGLRAHSTVTNNFLFYATRENR